MNFRWITILLQWLFTKKLLISSTKFFYLSAMNFFMLRFDRFTLFVYTSSVIFDTSPDLPTIGDDFLPLLSKKNPNLCVFSVWFFRQWVSLISQQLVSPFFRTRMTTLTNRQPFSLGRIDLFSVCIEEHLIHCGIIVIHVLDELLLGESLLGHGLLIELDLRLCEEIVGLVTCGRRLVNRSHLLGEMTQRILLLNLGEVAR